MMTDSFPDKHKSSERLVSFIKAKAEEGGDSVGVFYAVNSFSCVDMTDMMNAYTTICQAKKKKKNRNYIICEQSNQRV